MGLCKVTHLCSVKGFNTKEKKVRREIPAGLLRHRTGLSVSVDTQTRPLISGIKYWNSVNPGKLI